MRKILQAGVVLGLVLAAGTVRAERWAVDPDRAEVVFTSKAPLETFKGRTGLLTGWVEFDPADLQSGVDGELTVDLASFDTGKKKRNQHMRENHLETARFPVARLRPMAVVSAAPDALPDEGVARLVLQCELDLHGVRRTMECAIYLDRTGTGTLKVSAGFPVLLSDHAMERPKFLVMKLADKQMVDVAFVLHPEVAP